MAIIHGGGNHLCYDILYKLNWFDRLRINLAKRILKPLSRRIPYRVAVKDPDPPEYTANCPEVMEYKAKGWTYYCSGDTNHTEFILRGMGLENPLDKAGLISYLLLQFDVDRIEIKLKG